MKIQLHCILILLSSISTSFSEGLITSYTNGIIEASENSGMWRLTGSSVYSTSEASDTNTTWEFKSKDTIMYNSDGRIVARFQSFSHTGWESDSVFLYPGGSSTVGIKIPKTMFEPRGGTTR